ncbi:MAG: EamA family transporter, partial [Candidatus Hydrogenedentes bacterium]|nr:EamA family transporter [Candidatus Hydrogenedentota bacterium]
MAWFTLIISVVSWALAPVLIRYLSDAYEPYGQNLVRYGNATVILIIVSALFYREDLLKVLRNPYAVLGLAALNLLQQTT